MHADHTLGLPGLIASMNLLGRKSDLDIYGPEELEPMVRKVWYLTGTHIEFEVHFYATCSNAPSIITSGCKDSNIGIILLIILFKNIQF